MLEVLKIIKEKQQEAKKIINEASIEAQKIKHDLLQKSVAANEEAYLAEIVQAEKRADELLNSSSLGIDQQIKQILSKGEQQAKEIEIKAKINHEKAVNNVLDIIFNLPMEIIFVLFSFISGVILYTIIREVLPENESGRPLYFLLGIVIFLIIIITFESIFSLFTPSP